MPDDDSGTESVSAHRAFMYSLAFPGWGEWYAGSAGRAMLTVSLMCLSLFVLAWSCYEGYGAAHELFSSLKRDLSKGGVELAGMFGKPVALFAVSVLLFYFTWMWAMISSVDLACTARKKRGLTAQSNPYWALAMTYLCPGAGQVYMGASTWGYWLYAFSLFAYVSMLPAARDFLLGLQGIQARPPAGGGMSAFNPGDILARFQELRVCLTYSTGSFLVLAVSCFALAETASLASPWWYGGARSRTGGDGGKDPGSSRRGMAILAEAFVSYLAPGGGQLLAGRNGLGWRFLQVYLAVTALVSLGLQSGMISPSMALNASWAATIVQWGAVAEVFYFRVLRQSGDKRA